MMRKITYSMIVFLFSVFVLVISNSCGDTGNTSTGGAVVNIYLRADANNVDSKGNLEIDYWGHPEILKWMGGKENIPKKLEDNFWSLSINYNNDDKKSTVIEKNKTLFSFVNNTNQDFYIFYTLNGVANYYAKDIDSYDLLSKAGFKFDYINTLLDIYKQEDNDPNFELKDSMLVADKKTGAKKEYIDRFIFYEKLIESGYPYIKKLKEGEEYILRWE